MRPLEILEKASSRKAHIAKGSARTSGQHRDRFAGNAISTQTKKPSDVKARLIATGSAVQGAPAASGRPTIALAPHAAHAAISAALEKVQSGIPLQEFEQFARKLGISQEELARKIGTSPATLARNKQRAHPVLDTDRSDRLLRYQRLFEQAVKLFDQNEENASAWLKYPQRALAYQRPIDVAETEAGAREVENVIGRLEYGELT